MRTADLPDRTPRHEAVGSLAILAVVAVLLGGATAATRSPVVAIVALVGLGLAAQALLLSSRARGRCSQALRSARRLLGRGLVALVLLPVFVALSVVGRVSSVRRNQDDGTGWIVRDAPSPDRGTRPYSASPARATQDRRGTRGVVIRTVLCVLVIQAVVVGVVMIRSRPADPFAGGVSQAGVIESAALRDLPWVDAAAAEMGEVSGSTVYVPYTGLALRDYSGRYVNVQNRVRASYVPRLPMDEALDVWFFGGSTTFGFDLQRDAHTIPSEVVRLAEADGIAVRARNYGAPGYVNFQETVLLEILLGLGERPDLVVFYDGINDVSAQLLNVAAHSGPPGEPAYITAEFIRTILAGSEMLPEGSPAPPGPLVSPRTDQSPLSTDGIVSSVVRPYTAGVDLSLLLARAHGFEAVHFWQPDLYSREPLDPGERDLFSTLDLDEAEYEVMVALNERIREALPSAAVDLSDALNHVDGPVLSDVVHLNEEGGRAVAQAMYQTLGPELLELAGPGR